MRNAFTLLEVLIAGAILFMALFAILALFANTLRSARALQRTTVDAGVLAAQLSFTNRLTEGVESGDFGDLYPEHRWEQRTYEASSNGLWQVDFTVYRRGGTPESEMSILLFSPESSVGVGGIRPGGRR